MRMWTAQTSVVDETLARDGVSYVKKEYLRKKYRETAWVFITAYDFMIRELAKRVEKPAEAESPVWVFRDKARVFCAPGSILYELEIPEDEMVLFDLRDWQDILSLRPLGTPAEREAFLSDVRRQGIGDTSDIFKNAFYPVLKRRIMESWKQLLKGPAPDETWQQAAVWCLKKEWIVRRIPV